LFISPSLVSLYRFQPMSDFRSGLLAYDPPRVCPPLSLNHCPSIFPPPKIFPISPDAADFFRSGQDPVQSPQLHFPSGVFFPDNPLPSSFLCFRNPPHPRYDTHQRKTSVTSSTCHFVEPFFPPRSFFLPTGSGPQQEITFPQFRNRIWASNRTPSQQGLWPPPPMAIFFPI